MFNKNPSYFKKDINRRREPLTDTNLLMIIAIAVFVIFYLYAMLFTDSVVFKRPQGITNNINVYSYLILLSCGLSIVMIGGGIDISVGGVAALSAMSCALFMNGRSGSVLGALVLAIGIGLGFGLLHGFLVAYLDIQPFIITLAGMFLARGLTSTLSAEAVKVTLPGFSALKDWSLKIPGLGYYAKASGNFMYAEIQLEALIALAAVVILFVVLKWTRFGRKLYALGGNSQSAMMLGINTKRTKLFSYLLSGALAGLGGYCILLISGTAQLSGASGAEMQAIAASIIGGTLLTGGVGNIFGTFFGVLLLTTINQIISISGEPDSALQGIINGILLCLFIVFQSVIVSLRGRKVTIVLPAWPGKKTEEARTEGTVSQDMLEMGNTNSIAEE